MFAPSARRKAGRRKSPRSIIGVASRRWRSTNAEPKASPAMTGATLATPAPAVAIALTP
jgi:hypothetical protein